MAKIGILPVDSSHPNYALMKVSAYYKSQGAEVEIYNPFFRYDLVYASKIFTFTPDYPHPIPDPLVKGGTGYDLTSQLPDEIERMSPDYDLYRLDHRYALGFLTRGCPNKCPWCVVPRKEGVVSPYRDIEEVSEGGIRDRVTLMDNNVLASDYGLSQIEKIVRLGVSVDFNQGLDARRVDMETAQLLARVKWLKHIRFACDTSAQLTSVKNAVRRLRDAGYSGEVFVYCLINSGFHESYDRIMAVSEIDKRVLPYAQPYRDFSGKTEPPQWQKDMAHWVNRKWIFRATSFEDFSPRKGFKCSEYFNNLL